jgi:hypothetical protein
MLIFSPARRRLGRTPTVAGHRADGTAWGAQFALRKHTACEAAGGRPSVSSLVPRTAKRSLASVPKADSSSSALGIRVVTSTADADRIVGGGPIAS